MNLDLYALWIGRCVLLLGGVSISGVLLFCSYALIAGLMKGLAATDDQ